MDFNKAALEMHETHHGKVGIVSKVEVKNRDQLATAYTPGVAEPCRKIRENPDDVYKYTFKSNMVAVVSNGTAVLGLGDIGPEAGLPVMEGKAVLFKEFGGVDAFPICIDAHDAASVIAACKAIAPTFGGINLEDIKSPECFEIEETLERELDIPVFHDDQHGTAIVVTAALINALRVVGKKMENVRIVLNGPGAAGTAIIKMLMTAGAKDIIAVDQFGTLYKGCNSAEAHKNWLGEVTNPRQIRGGLKEALAGADVFIGVSKPGILTTELCRTMNKDAIVFAMANPTPEIMPDEAKAGGVRVMATGRSDFPNQVNNVLCFPGLFRGALSVRARDINDKMKLAAAYAIADLITDDDRSEENIIPRCLRPPGGRGCGERCGRSCPRERRGPPVNGGSSYENHFRAADHGHRGPPLHRGQHPPAPGRAGSTGQGPGRRALAAGKEHPRPALVEPRGGERRRSAHLSGYRHGLRLRGAGDGRPHRRQL